MFVIASIKVKNFEKLALFESQASEILLSVGGEMIQALEVESNPDGSGEEIHILRFPSNESFQLYKQKTDTDILNKLKNEAIENLDIKLSTKTKVYVRKKSQPQC